MHDYLKVDMSESDHKVMSFTETWSLDLAAAKATRLGGASDIIGPVSYILMVIQNTSC